MKMVYHPAHQNMSSTPLPSKFYPLIHKTKTDGGESFSHGIAQVGPIMAASAVTTLCNMARKHLPQTRMGSVAWFAGSVVAYLPVGYWNAWNHGKVGEITGHAVFQHIATQLEGKVVFEGQISMGKDE